MAIPCQNFFICCIKIAVDHTIFVVVRDKVPECLTSFLISSSHYPGYYLPGALAKGYPNPAFIGFAVNETP
jgi:hypothetical protein